MVEKNAKLKKQMEDDYYKNNSSNSQEKKSSKPEAQKDSKPKFKVKKKPAIKAVKKTDEKGDKNPKTFDKKKKDFSNKKDNSNFKDKKDQDRKKANSAIISWTAWVPKTDKKPVRKNNFNDNKKPWEETSSNKFDNSKYSKPKKAFKSKDKVKSSSKDASPSKQEADKKKNKFAKHKRFGGKFQLEKTNEFVRSNKIKAKKKEEKNVENIEQSLVDRKWETVVIPDVINVKEFSEKMWVPIAKIMGEFMKNGMMVNLNAQVDFETCCIIAEAFEIKLERDRSEGISIDDIMHWDIESLLVEDDSSNLEERAPIISVMWHVDHWKTSLLDYIRSEKVAEKEAGWITQSIWAYQVEVKDKKLTFLDTPWHEAFTVMRARWAKSTDIAILVVAADEWVKPQTIESISHAREAGIPIIVAINKMDKTWANPDHVKWQLAEKWVTPEDWWGDTPMIWVSAKTWEWIDDLLEVVMLVWEMSELKANSNRAWVWTVIESHLDVKFWPISTVLINTWTLSKWDNIVCAWAYWKVKVLKNHIWKNIESASPWMPVLIVWLDSVVEWWDILQVVSDTETARRKAIEFMEVKKSKKTQSASGLEMIMSKIKSWMLKDLKIVVKADTNGSLEAIKASLLKLSNEWVKIAIVHSWVWNINESDALMASASQTIVVWFNVSTIWTSKEIIEEHWIELIEHRVIYHITERVEAIATWMLDPKEVEVVLWEAKVKAMFYDGKKFTIIWISLKDEAKAEKWAKVRVIRWDKLVWKWIIDNLKQWVEEVPFIEWPIECWIQFSWNVKPLEWDILEIYKIEIHK